MKFPKPTRDKLAEIAGAATPGPWKAHRTGLSPENMSCVAPIIRSYNATAYVKPEDGRYLEAFAPPTLLALLGALERCREQLALMSEGEGDDAKVYQTMSRACLREVFGDE